MACTYKDAPHMVQTTNKIGKLCIKFQIIHGDRDKLISRFSFQSRTETDWKLRKKCSKNHNCSIVL